METDRRKKQYYSIWVNWENRVISFHKVEGFEERRFPTHKEMFQFAVEKGFGGFAVM